MGLESSATYINDLQPTNPTSTDGVTQGDDHLRLIKQVLQNTFAGASRQWQIPGAVAISTTGPITKANGESVIFVSTGGGPVTLTLPALVALDAGWKTVFIKTSSDVNQIFIAPPSGTINSGGVAGLSKARRCIPGVQFIAFWDGTNWFVTRVTSLPIGSCIEYHGTTLPAGYEWPNGQTLSSATNYPEYNAVTGGLVTKDKRGYTSICVDNLGGAAAGHLPTTYIASTTAFAVGGSDHASLAAGNIPNLSVSVGGSISGSATCYPGGNSTYNVPVSTSGWGAFPAGATGGGYVTPECGFGGSGSVTYVNTFTGPVSGSCSATGTATGSGSGAGNAFAILSPAIMVNQILVVE